MLPSMLDTPLTSESAGEFDRELEFPIGKRHGSKPVGLPPVLASLYKIYKHKY